MSRLWGWWLSPRNPRGRVWMPMVIRRLWWKRRIRIVVFGFAIIQCSWPCSAFAWVSTTSHQGLKWYQAVLILRKASFQNGIDLQMIKVSKWNVYIKGIIIVCHLFLLLLLLHMLLNSSYQPHTFIIMLNKIRRRGKPELVGGLDIAKKAAPADGNWRELVLVSLLSKYPSSWLICGSIDTMCCGNM